MREETPTESTTPALKSLSQALPVKTEKVLIKGKRILDANTGKYRSRDQVIKKAIRKGKSTEAKGEIVLAQYSSDNKTQWGGDDLQIGASCVGRADVKANSEGVFQAGVEARVGVRVEKVGGYQTFMDKVKPTEMGSFQLSAQSVGAEGSLTAHLSTKTGFQAEASAKSSATLAGVSARASSRKIRAFGATVQMELNGSADLGLGVEAGAGIQCNKTNSKLSVYAKGGVHVGAGIKVSGKINLGVDSQFQQESKTVLQQHLESQGFTPEFVKKAAANPFQYAAALEMMDDAAAMTLVETIPASFGIEDSLEDTAASQPTTLPQKHASSDVRVSQASAAHFAYRSQRTGSNQPAYSVALKTPVLNDQCCFFQPPSTPPVTLTAPLAGGIGAALAATVGGGTIMFGASATGLAASLSIPLTAFSGGVIVAAALLALGIGKGFDAVWGKLTHRYHRVKRLRDTVRETQLKDWETQLHHAIPASERNQLGAYLNEMHRLTQEIRNGANRLYRHRHNKKQKVERLQQELENLQTDLVECHHRLNGLLQEVATPLQNTAPLQDVTVDPQPLDTTPPVDSAEEATKNPSVPAAISQESTPEEALSSEHEMSVEQEALQQQEIRQIKKARRAQMEQREFEQDQADFSNFFQFMGTMVNQQRQQRQQREQRRRQGRKNPYKVRTDLQVASLQAIEKEAYRPSCLANLQQLQQLQQQQQSTMLEKFRGLNGMGGSESVQRFGTFLDALDEPLSDTPSFMEESFPGHPFRLFSQRLLPKPTLAMDDDGDDYTRECDARY